jgi:hypothetical protein
MILYHRTTAANAEQIVRDGFALEHSGVWLSNRPINEGAYGDVLLKVDLPEEAIADYEWIEEVNPIANGLFLRS